MLQFYGFRGARQNKIKAVAIGGVADHVHLLLSVPATLSIAMAMQLIKGGSSKWVHETFPEQRQFGWQKKYSSGRSTGPFLNLLGERSGMEVYI